MRQGHGPAGHVAPGQRRGMRGGHRSGGQQEQRHGPGPDAVGDGGDGQDGHHAPDADQHRRGHRRPAPPQRVGPVAEHHQHDHVPDPRAQAEGQHHEQHQRADQQDLHRQRSREDGLAHPRQPLLRHSPARQGPVVWPHLAPSCRSLYSALPRAYSDTQPDTGREWPGQAVPGRPPPQSPPGPAAPRRADPARVMAHNWPAPFRLPAAHHSHRPDLVFFNRLEPAKRRAIPPSGPPRPRAQPAPANSSASR